MLKYLANLTPFFYLILCWIQLALTGNPAGWNILGRLLLSIVH